MFLNRASQYALELVFYLSKHPDQEWVRLNEVAKELGLSFHFLGKVAQQLVHKGILSSTRGPRGGVGLARTGQPLSQHEVIQAVEGDRPLNQCVLRPRECDRNHPCPLHHAWEPIMATVQDALKESPLGVDQREVQAALVDRDGQPRNTAGPTGAGGAKRGRA
jgi:Rrf2 family protein